MEALVFSVCVESPSPSASSAAPPAQSADRRRRRGSVWCLDSISPTRPPATQTSSTPRPRSEQNGASPPNFICAISPAIKDASSWGVRNKSAQSLHAQTRSSPPALLEPPRSRPPRQVRQFTSLSLFVRLPVYEEAAAAALKGSELSGKSLLETSAFLEEKEKSFGISPNFDS